MSGPLDSELCKELAGYIETLTHTGLKTLDDAVMKKLKKICRQSDGYVEHAYHLVLFQLERPHAEIRYSAFQIIDELFRRSHCFRELLVSKMQLLMELTVETSPDNPLPPPRTVALNLKKLALRAIRDWNSEFGDGYKKLQLGYNFLKHCKKVDFSALEMEDSAQRMRQQELERRQKVISEERLKKVEAEMRELEVEINGTLTSMKNCLELLLPAPKDFFIFDESATDKDSGNLLDRPSTYKSGNDNRGGDNKDSLNSLDKPSTSKSGNDNKGEDSDEETDGEEEDDENFHLAAHGFVNPNFKMELELRPDGPVVKETPENAAIFENARDLKTLIVNRYLPCMKKWENMITKSAGSSGLLKKVIDLKQALEDVVKKYSQLNIQTVSGNDSDTSDSEFEEVADKDDYEDTVHEDLPPLNLPVVSSSRKEKNDPKVKKESGWSIWSHENSDKDPTSAQSTLAALTPAKSTEVKPMDEVKERKEKPKDIPPPDPQPSTSSGNDRKSKLLAVAPKLPFDVDLYHWEDENITAPTMLSVKPEGARFWSATSNDDLEEIPVPEGAASLRTRVIEFSGKFEPVKWACRAPLKSGKLCPRRDRYKCPFHGPIVARDEMGRCANPEDEKKLKQYAEEQQETPDWQDPELLADIKANTGIDLKMPERGKDGKLKRKKKKQEEEKKYPGITDLSASENNSFKRLAKKVFKRSTMKRVALAMDRADHKKYRDKFGDQFNYVYDR